MKYIMYIYHMEEDKTYSKCYITELNNCYCEKQRCSLSKMVDAC